MTRMQRRLVSLLFVTLTPALHAEVLNRVVLRVNDQIATLRDYQLRKEDYVREVLRREQDPQERTRQLSEAGENVFADMFRDLMLQSRADQLGVEISETQIDESVGQLRQNFGIKTDEEFAAALAQSGLTLEQFRTQIKGNLRVQEVRGREVQSRVKVDEDDLRRYYRKNEEQFRVPEQLQLREVVVLDEGSGTGEEHRRLADEIRRQAAAGKPLAEAVAAAAKPGATNSVIDHGWVSPGDLDKSLEAAVWKLPKGAVSEPVAGRGGLHLLQVVDRRDSHIPPFNEVAGAIRQKEQERVFRQEILKYMAELEKKALIVANPPDEAANYRQRLSAKNAEEAGLDSPAMPEPVDPTADLQAPAPAPTPPPIPPPGPTVAPPPQKPPLHQS